MNDLDKSEQTGDAGPQDTEPVSAAEQPAESDPETPEQAPTSSGAGDELTASTTAEDQPAASGGDVSGDVERPSEPPAAEEQPQEASGEPETAAGRDAESDAVELAAGEPEAVERAEGADEPHREESMPTPAEDATEPLEASIGASADEVQPAEGAAPQSGMGTAVEASGAVDEEARESGEEFPAERDAAEAQVPEEPVVEAAEPVPAPEAEPGPPQVVTEEPTAAQEPAVQEAAEMLEPTAEAEEDAAAAVAAEAESVGEAEEAVAEQEIEATAEAEEAVEAAPPAAAAAAEKKKKKKKKAPVPQEAAAQAAMTAGIPGIDWYIIHTYSGFENKVRESLRTRAEAFGFSDRVGEILIPTEDVVEMKSGKKVTSKRLLYPGYVLVQLKMDDEIWHVVKNTPRVTGFVGSGPTPTPLTADEVNQILFRQTASEEKPRPKLTFERSDRVRIVDGPFTNFTGTVEEVNTERNTMKVMVTIFGRGTPVELEHFQVEKEKI